MASLTDLAYNNYIKYVKQSSYRMNSESGDFEDAQRGKCIKSQARDYFNEIIYGK